MEDDGVTAADIARLKVGQQVRDAWGIWTVVFPPEHRPAWALVSVVVRQDSAFRRIDPLSPGGAVLVVVDESSAA